MFHRILSNVKQEGTAELIIPIRMNSQDAAIGLNIQADFISLVGANDEGLFIKIFYLGTLIYLIQGLCAEIIGMNLLLKSV